MDPSLFILAITLYLVSMVATLVASFFEKHIPDRLVNTLIIFHWLVFIVWFLLRNPTHTVEEPGNSNYLFLTFFCSGILASGILLRKKYPIYLKGYFMLFLLSLPIFIVVPSRVLGFICSAQINAVSPPRIHLSENYYLVGQGSSKLPPEKGKEPFKLIREMGMFHKTLARDIMIPSPADSIILLEFKENENIFVRTYYHGLSGPDSIDLNIILKSIKDSSQIITRKIN
ncbi:MAG: hypothetical protein IPN13_09035 [Bacteroidetes bacterium]|nr:hypothetical protein [Bacteroidota bacterium]